MRAQAPYTVLGWNVADITVAVRTLAGRQRAVPVAIDRREFDLLWAETMAHVGPVADVR